jgi:hypothetical protein
MMSHILLNCGIFNKNINLIYTRTYFKTANFFRKNILSRYNIELLGFFYI